jgi:hypothetical protein
LIGRSNRAGAAWLADFERELLAFPAGEYDDQVDAFSQALMRLAGSSTHRRQRSRGRTITGGLLTKEL